MLPEPDEDKIDKLNRKMAELKQFCEQNKISTELEAKFSVKHSISKFLWNLQQR